jgi:maltooligosyltrehalose trehalohydrolase
VELNLEVQTFPMSKDEFGYWKTEVKNIAAGSLYKFVIDGQEFPDPASISQPSGVHEKSQVLDRKFQWTDMSWQGIALENMIIYELHVGTFSPAGTFDGAIEKLDYLQGLGINAIELMPIAQFPGERNWGYDGVCPFAVQNSYGGIEGLKQLVDEAHRRDIAVILDVVYNHFGPEGNYMEKFGPYFTDKYKTFWGKAVNFDDAFCDGVRNYFFQNALMWLNDFHIDGLRLDAVHAIWDFSAMPFVAQLQSKVKALEMQSGRRKVLIAEFDLNNPRYISAPSKGGYGLDGQWVDEFHHAIHAVTTGETNGYYEDFGSTAHIAKALRDSYVYTGQYSTHRKKTFGVYPLDNPFGQFIAFAQNHDQIGNRLAGDRLTTQLSFEGLKLVAASYLLTPHVPLIFMGEEYGETNPFQYFISHSDAALVEAVRKGRNEEFAHFGWKDEVPDPQDEKTFAACKLSWSFEEEKRKVLLDYYKSLITFRKTRRAYLSKERNSVTVYPETETVVCFEKFSSQDRILIVLNFGKDTQQYINPLELSIKKIFDSSSRSWLGTSDFTNELVEPSTPILLQSESVQIFEKA